MADDNNEQERKYLLRIFTGKNITILLQLVSEENMRIMKGENLKDIKAFLQAYAVIRCIPCCKKYADLMETFHISKRQIEQCSKIIDALEKDKDFFDLFKSLLQAQENPQKPTTP